MCDTCTCDRSEKAEIGRAINDNGGWEEFHQKRGNGYMQSYHKAQRLKLQEKYDAMV